MVDVPRGPRVYLDHAASTPVHPGVVEVVTRHLRETGNPSSAHTSGRRARAAVEEARECVAEALDAPARGVVFTSGGTEADNLAVKGLYWTRHGADSRRQRVLVSAVEHHAVLGPADWLAKAQGAQVCRVPVDERARLDLAALDSSVAEDPTAVALVSVMWGNNEVGTLQPIREVVQAAHAAGIPVHTDAVQAVGRVPVSLAAAGVDAMSVSGHKIGAPQGVGALILSSADLVPEPVLHGGGQEWALRSGTVDVASVAGFAAAVRLAVTGQAERAARLDRLAGALTAAVRAAAPGCVVNGDPDPAGRLPGIVHVSIPGCEGESLLLLLDREGIDCSTGSACYSGVTEPSHVVLAMGGGPALAGSSLRFSLGDASTDADVAAVARVLPGVVERARAAGFVNVRSG